MCISLRPDCLVPHPARGAGVSCGQRTSSMLRASTLWLMASILHLPVDPHPGCIMWAVEM